MARDHKAVNDQALALVAKLGVTPEDNADEPGAVGAATAKLAELEALDGAAFDAAYVANEVAYHQTVNGALSTVLIPSAQNAELKALLETGLKLFTEHQHHAEHLAMTVQKMPMRTLTRLGALACWSWRGACPIVGRAGGRLYDRARQDGVRRRAGATACRRHHHLAERRYLPPYRNGPRRAVSTWTCRRNRKRVMAVGAAGSVDFFCRFHPGMTGTLVIAPIKPAEQLALGRASGRYGSS